MLAAGEFGVRDHVPLVSASPREHWTVPKGSARTGCSSVRNPTILSQTCAILTTAADEAVAPVHSGLPIILPCGAYGVRLAGDVISLAPVPQRFCPPIH